MAYYNSISEVLNEIITQKGIKVFSDSRMVLAIFGDLAPQMRKEKELLSSFCQENGFEKALEVKNASMERQTAFFSMMVDALNRNHWVSKDAAEMVCAEVLTAVTGKTWKMVKPAPAPRPAVPRPAAPQPTAPTQKTSSILQSTPTSVSRQFDPKWIIAAAAVIVVIIMIALISGKKDTPPGIPEIPEHPPVIVDDSNGGRDSSGQNTGKQEVDPGKENDTSTKPQTVDPGKTETTGGGTGGNAVEVNSSHSEETTTVVQESSPEPVVQESSPEPVGPQVIAEANLANYDNWVIAHTNNVNTDIGSIHNDKEDVCVGSFPDNFGNSWMNAYKFWVLNAPGYSATESITYSLSGQSYNVLSGTIVGGKLTDGRCASGCYMFFRIYVDGQLKYTSPSFNDSTPPFQYEIDIDGASSITIEGVGETANINGECLITLNLKEIR